MLMERRTGLSLTKSSSKSKIHKIQIKNADGQDDRLFKYSSSKSKIHKIQNTDGEEDRSSKYKIIVKI